VRSRAREEDDKGEKSTRMNHGEALGMEFKSGETGVAKRWMRARGVRGERGA